MPLKIDPPTSSSSSSLPSSQIPDSQSSSASQHHQRHVGGPLTLADLPPPQSPTYSPITPKAQPALPATYSSTDNSHGAQQYRFVPPAPARPSQRNHDESVESAHARSTEQHRSRQQIPWQQQYQKLTQAQPPKMDSHIPSSDNARPAMSETLSTSPTSKAAHDAPQQQAQDSPATDQILAEYPLQLPAKSTIQPTQYISAPPNLPFSDSDATDAIALRAAISSLQFQKQKAQNDLRQLEKIKTLALEDPASFRTELAAGSLQEQKDKTGDLSNILDQIEDGDSEDEVDFSQFKSRSDASMNEVTDCFANDASSVARKPQAGQQSKTFPAIPGPQNVVRMPHVNWDKYHVLGEPLDRMHELQRKWPGNESLVSSDRGRPFAPAAPYSPFYDKVDGSMASDRQQQQRQQRPPQSGNDSSRSASEHGGSSSAAPSPLTNVSEHPMATRRGSSKPHQA